MSLPRVAHIGWLASCHLQRRVKALGERGLAQVVYTDQVPDYMDSGSMPYAVQVLPRELLDNPLALLDWFNNDLARRGILVLHSHSTHFPGSLGLFATGVVRVNAIWDFVYAKDPLSPLYHQGILEGLQSGRLAEAVSFSSPVVRREWLGAGYPEDRALLHSWGVDTACFCPVETREVERLRQRLGLSPNETVVLSSRTTSLPANLDVLIQAVTRLRRTMPVRLVVIGGAVTREARYLEGLLAGDAAREAVVFAGSVRGDEALGAYYAMARVVASVHSNDHNPATVLEALAMRRPVVVCDIPTVAYWAREGQTGFAVPHRDVAATAAALERVVTMPAKAYEAMGREGRTLVELEADFSQALARVEKDYARAAALEPSRAPGSYELGLLCDQRGRHAMARDLYARFVEQDPETGLVAALMREKQALLAPEPEVDYFCRERAQPGVAAMAEAAESDWPKLARGLPAPLSLFRHDYIAAAYPLLQTDPEACQRLFSVLANRFACDEREWFAEAVQWFGGVLGLWGDCAHLLLALPGPGGASLAVHALGCAKALGKEHRLHTRLLEKAIDWSGEPIGHVAPWLDRLFRADVHAEAAALLEGKEPVGPSVIERSRVYATTDRPWLPSPWANKEIGL